MKRKNKSVTRTRPNVQRDLLKQHVLASNDPNQTAILLNNQDMQGKMIGSKGINDYFEGNDNTVNIVDKDVKSLNHTTDGLLDNQVKISHSNFDPTAQ